jgi:hypothetical protein
VVTFSGSLSLLLGNKREPASSPGTLTALFVEDADTVRRRWRTRATASRPNHQASARPADDFRQA